jgi:hypothetical protein
VLIMAGFLIGRSQAGGEPVAAAGTSAPAPTAEAEPAPSESAAGSPEPVGGIDAYAPLQVEDAVAQSGVEFQDTADEGGGRNVGWTNAGDWLRFDGVDFGATPPASVNLRVASESPASGRIEIRVDDPGAAPVATLTTSHTGGWQNWRTETTPVEPVTGRHTVYVTFGSDRPDDLVNVNWLVFRR